MLRIGEVAKKYGISNRTLRYWEDVGILKSARAENGYRFYDDENAARIKEIVLLRKLKMPIADIEKIFISDDLCVAADTLKKYLASLRRDAKICGYLIAAVEELIRHVKNAKNLQQVFLYLETKTAPQIQLSEREISMARIVSLPAMTVAAFRAESTSPEDDCSKVFNPFVLENNLHKRDGYRYFGFNNPNPTVGNPFYGYEMWVTIPEDFIVPPPFEKKQFAGGLYASVSTPMNEIGERWRLLNEWCKADEKYKADYSFQWIEECTMPFETFISAHVPDNEKQLDLLHPIKERLG
jgi:DNA-binding transcriptional MerR regulator